MTMGIFAVPVAGRWLIHAPLHGLSAVVNRSAADALAADLRRASEAPARSDTAADLVEPNDLGAMLDTLREPVEAPKPRTGRLAPQFLGLVPTRGCNLRCGYCGFGATPHAAVMTPALAVAAVNWMATLVRRGARDTLEVHFFGGEPFAAFETVEAAVLRTQLLASQDGVASRLEVTTNGAYSEERARFAGDHFDTVVLSLDGFARHHDRHRLRVDGTGSFATVVRTAGILSASPTELCLRVCVAEDNLDALPEIVDWFCEAFRPSAIDVETLQQTPEAEVSGLRPPDPYRFARQFLATRRVGATHAVHVGYAAADLRHARTSFCPLGHDALIVHPDGGVTGCYLLDADWRARGLDLALGGYSEEHGFHIDTDAIQRVRALTGLKPGCARCFCRWSCAGGCHVHHSYPGCATSYDDFCRQTRLITACLLLDELGLAALGEDLIGDAMACEALAHWPDDHVDPAAPHGPDRKEA